MLDIIKNSRDKRCILFNIRSHDNDVPQLQAVIRMQPVENIILENGCLTIG